MVADCQVSQSVKKSVNKGSHPEKKSVSVWIFSKGKGGGGGSCPNRNVLRNYWVLFMFGHFSVRGGGLPSSKNVGELLSLCGPIPKSLRNFLLLF